MVCLSPPLFHTNRCDIILDACLKDLSKLDTPYKFVGMFESFDDLSRVIVTVGLAERSSGTLLNCYSCYWDQVSDGM